MKKILLLFPSIHFVLKAEKFLQEHKVPCEMVPVPKEIRGDCGMALLVPEGYLALVRDLLSDVKLDPETIYEKQERTYRRIDHGKDHRDQ